MLLLYISDRFPSFSRIIQIVTQISNEYYMIVFITSLKNKKRSNTRATRTASKKDETRRANNYERKKKNPHLHLRNFSLLTGKGRRALQFTIVSLVFFSFFFFSPIFLSFFLSFLNETLHDVRWTIVVGRRNCDDSITMNIP